MATSAPRTRPAALVGTASLIVAVLTGFAPPATAAEPTVPQPSARGPAPGATAAYATPGLALPAWADTLWGPAEYGTTIQTGDLDGDGLGDLVGRGPYGLEVNTFDGDFGQWTQVGVENAAPFTDAEGWNRAQYYGTIRIADVDGDGRAEAMGRGAAGVEVFDLDAIYNDQTGITDHMWVRGTTVAAFTEAWWSDAEYYSTIQTADLDGDGDAEILGRGRDGVEAWGIDPATGSWSELPLLTGLSDTNGYLPAQYSSTFQTADVDGDGRDEMLIRSPKGVGVEVYSLSSDGEGWDQRATAPHFIDAGVWSHVSSYSTIQAADLDGDGRDDVFGRAGGGIVAYGYDPSDGWTALTALTGDFVETSTEPWASSAALYSTIQAADIDGDGQAEILGRGTHGMHVWALTNSGKKWKPLARSGPFADDTGWSRALAYPTIQTADIDGFAPLQKSGVLTEARSELIGRGPTGVQTYRWDPQKQTWVSPSAVFADWSSPSAGASYQAYTDVNQELGGSENDDFDLRSYYADAETGQLNSWKTTIEQMSVPRGIPLAVWTAVTTQLVDELNAVIHVREWYDAIRQNIQTLYEGRSMDPTADLLSYDKRRDTELAGSIFNVFGGMIHALAAATGPEGNGVGAAIASVISAGVDFGTSEVLNSFEAAYLDVNGLLEVSFQGALDGEVAARTAAATDLGLLMAVDDLIANGVWLPAPAVGEGLAAALKVYSVWVWQLLTPHIWKTGSWSDSHQYCDDRGCWNLVRDNILHTGIEKKIRDQLFGHTDATCRSGWDPATCHLGQSREAVFTGLDGWNIPCFSGPDTVTPCPPGPKAAGSP